MDEDPRLVLNMVFESSSECWERVWDEDAFEIWDVEGDLWSSSVVVMQHCTKL